MGALPLETRDELVVPFVMGTLATSLNEEQLAFHGYGVCLTATNGNSPGANSKRRPAGFAVASV